MFKGMRVLLILCCIGVFFASTASAKELVVGYLLSGYDGAIIHRGKTDIKVTAKTRNLYNNDVIEKKGGLITLKISYRANTTAVQIDKTKLKIVLTPEKDKKSIFSKALELIGFDMTRYQEDKNFSHDSKTFDQLAIGGGQKVEIQQVNPELESLISEAQDKINDKYINMLDRKIHLLLFLSISSNYYPEYQAALRQKGYETLVELTQKYKKSLTSEQKSLIVWIVSEYDLEKWAKK